MKMEHPKIKIKGLNKRGKNRIETYSDDGIFFLRRDLRPEGEEKILVGSLEKNFRLGRMLTEWAGWFDVGTEVEIVEEEISTECT